MCQGRKNHNSLENLLSRMWGVIFNNVPMNFNQFSDELIEIIQQAAYQS